MTEPTLKIDATTRTAVGETFINEVLKRKLAEAKVLVEKQAAYGPFNIARPPHGISPQVALAVRINDKVQRLGNLLTSGQDTPTGSESRADTWGDVANYGTIGSMVEAGVWPGMDVPKVKVPDRKPTMQATSGAPRVPTAVVPASW